mmetsp:Transcript_9999/g.14725  ORF Transcript_9999/g.14725 Transcript_9999/m.14725 type:complete len:226 (-) Transcript_9999:69-746(-)
MVETFFKSGTHSVFSTNGSSFYGSINKKINQVRLFFHKKQMTDLKKPTKENGFKTPKYEWSQTLKDLTLEYPVTYGTRGKQVECTIAKSSLVLKVRGETLFNGSFPEDVIVDECFWSIEDRELLVLTLTKVKEVFWPCPVNGEPSIDIKACVPDAIHISTLDPEARSKVEKMMFDQRAKQMGQPTSDEVNQQRVMDKLMRENPNMMADYKKMTGQDLDMSKIQFK